MANILTVTDFTGKYYIANAVNQIATVQSQQTPNNSAELTRVITVTEKDILINALGLTIYNELQTALSDLDEAEQKYLDLINGVEYDNKVWGGLKEMLINAVYYEFNNELIRGFSSTNGMQTNLVDGAISGTSKLVNVWNDFVLNYQSYHNPIVVSLYEFLTDKKEDYSFESANFKTYYLKNSIL